jgi:hypothetical protein
VFGEDDVELRDELAQIVLPVAHETGAEAGELAQALDLRVRDVALLGGAGPGQARDDMGTMSSVLALRRTRSR